MKKLLMFIYSILAYGVGFVALLFWILSASNLIPAISIDRNPEMSFPLALLKNTGLVMLFGLHHSVTARRPFKVWLTRTLPAPVERSTFVLLSGILLAFLVWQWAPMGGVIWNVSPNSALYYFLYTLFFTGWSILLISTFIINHFDLFGLRQTYFELINKPYTNLAFRVKFFYKLVRHPLYLGGIIGLWATPHMTVTHLCFAILLSAYFIIGSLFEEKDLIREFGKQYQDYRDKTGKFIPRLKKNRKEIE